MPHAYSLVPVSLLTLLGCVGSSPIGTSVFDGSTAQASDSSSWRDMMAGSDPPHSPSSDLAADAARDFQDASDPMEADAGVPTDVATDSDGRSADGTVGPDAPRETVSDVAPESGRTDTAGMLPCSALKPLADLPLLGAWRTHYVYYSPDRSWLLLQVRDSKDRLIRVDLPSGTATTIVDGLNSAVPLGNGGPILLFGTGADGDDTSVYDGREVRKLWSGLWNFQPTPDGSRLFAVGSCLGGECGLHVFDVATGTASVVDERAVMATTWDIAVSPNGQWVAYTTGDNDVNNRTIAVASLAGTSYTIASAKGVDLLEFASDELLVFQTGGRSNYHGDIRGHVPGSGDTSFLIASDLYPGEGYAYNGYQFSPDRTRVLAVKMSPPSDTSRSASLYSVPLHGGDPLLLVEDWSLPYPDMTYAFAFDSQGKYAVYVSLRDPDLPSFEVWAVDMQGSTPRKLSNYWAFGLTPATSSVLLIDTDDDGRYHLRLTDLATGLDRLSYSSNDQPSDVTVLRGDQALVFAEYEYDSGTVRARFMSASHPQSVVLGEWNDPSCRGCSPMRVQADPTGCFTVVNTDVAPGPGTRLVLLPE